MKIKTLAALAAALPLVGCAICEQHRTACAAAGVLVVGAAALAVSRHDSDASDPLHRSHGPMCRPQPNGVCL